MRVIVTGASGGIGKAVVEKFIREGHVVYGVDRVHAKLFHPLYSHFLADIETDPLPDVQAEILVNNAGVQDSGRDVEINLIATMRVTERYLSPELASVLFIASASAGTGAEFPAYCASKGGVVSYMKNVALRMAEWGGTANSLSPGGVLTSLNDRVISDAQKWKLIMDETPLKKWATPEEIAEWTYFLTVINRSMTAQNIVVDNGESARAKFVW